jgi:hypothetical protein
LHFISLTTPFGKFIGKKAHHYNRSRAEIHLSYLLPSDLNGDAVSADLTFEPSLVYILCSLICRIILSKSTNIVGEVKIYIKISWEFLRKSLMDDISHMWGILYFNDLLSQGDCTITIIVSIQHLHLASEFNLVIFPCN